MSNPNTIEMIEDIPRQATTADIPKLIVMCERLHDEQQPAYRFDRETAKNEIETLLARDERILIISGDGFIAGSFIQSGWDANWILAVKSGWWSDGPGLLLLRAFEDFAQEAGANEIYMNLNGQDRQKQAALERHGYGMTEVVFTKVIGGKPTWRVH